MQQHPERKGIREWLLAGWVALTLGVPPLALAQSGQPTLELRFLEVDAVKPAEPIAIVAELVNTGSATIRDIAISGGGISLNSSAYAPELANDPAHVTSNLAPGARVKFVFAELYPRYGADEPKGVATKGAYVLVTAKGIQQRVFPTKPFEVEVSQTAAPLADRLARGRAHVPRNRRAISDQLDLSAWVEAAAVVAVVDISQVRPFPGGHAFQARVLEGVKGASIGQTLDTRGLEAQGCRWSVASGRHLVFLARVDGELRPLDCNGAFLPVENSSGDWYSGTLPWREIRTQVTRWSSRMNVGDVVRELNDANQALVATTAATPDAATPPPSARSLEKSGAATLEARVPLAPPNAFAGVPREVRAQLYAQACLVPQPWLDPEAPLANVISGEFARKGQRDWAVVCSTGGLASIVIFWGGPERCPSPIPASERSLEHCLVPPLPRAPKGADAPAMGSCRRIERIGADRVKARYHADSLSSSERADDPGDFDHDAVREELGDRVALSHYCDGTRWHRLLSDR